MAYDPLKHRRSSIRLKGFDYSRTGMYFVTICIEGRECLLGEIHNDRLVLKEAGLVMSWEWASLADRFHYVELDEFVIMPNHVHGIMAIVGDEHHRNKGDHKDRPYSIKENVGCTITNESNVPNCRGESRIRPCGTSENSLGRIIQAFKSLTTRHYARGVRNYGWQSFEVRLWQRNYHEHIVRNEQELENIRHYVVNNPLQWAHDRENPEAQTVSTKEPWED
jgi:REP element-mobilizing transposase RayT